MNLSLILTLFNVRCRLIVEIGLWEVHVSSNRRLNCPLGYAYLYFVDLEVRSKLAKRARIKSIASKFARDFECDSQHVNAFSHCVTMTRVLLPQIISCSDTKVSVLVVIECKRASVIYVYELIFLLHTSRSTGYTYRTPINITPQALAHRCLLTIIHYHKNCTLYFELHIDSAADESTTYTSRK